MILKYFSLISKKSNKNNDFNFTYINALGFTLSVEIFRCQFPPIFTLFAVIPKVMIEPSSPYNIFKGNSTRLKGSSGMTNRVPDNGSTRQPLRPPHIPAVITARPAPKPTVRPTPKPTTRPAPKPTSRFAPKQVTTRPVLKPATRPPPPPQPATSVSTPPPERMPGLTTEDPSLVLAEGTSPPGITVDNRIQIDPQKPRGDVFSK